MITTVRFYLGVLVCGVTFISSAYADAPNFLAINLINISRDNNNLATEIQLTNSGDTLTKWQLGFCYMQVPLIKLANMNPDLTMQICDNANQCTNLVYQKTTNMTEPDLSVAYTTILQPAGFFPLIHGGSYTIKLLNSNQQLPTNYANVPQNFFMINQESNQITLIPTEKNTYSLKNYDQSSIDNQITQHIHDNWNVSAAQLPLSNPVVPSPVNYQPGEGYYRFGQALAIHDLLPESQQSVAEFFRDYLAKDLNISAVIDNSADTNGIIIKKISDPDLINQNPEGYQIQVTPKNIIISVMNDTGAFYALQTLRQLWNNNKSLPVATITDYPRFKYRGVMLDTARHFFSVQEIKNLIELIATHKLNTLHIHFADDEGFRLALDAYPTLKTIGATRGYGQKNGPMLLSQANLDKTNFNGVYPTAETIYSHSYSKSDIQQLIAYANARKITIIPEIDIPGHARALIKSLPESFVDPDDHSLFTSVQGYADDVLPVCTYNTHISVGAKFTRDIDNIVSQIAALFNGQTTLYSVHNEMSVGADEVSADAWTDDASCQGEWASLSALAKGQKFFQSMAATHPQLIFSGWQQLVQNDDVSLGNQIVPAAQTGHIWVWNTSKQGIEQAASLAQHNYPTVLAFADQTYLDLTYTPDIDEPGFTWATNFSDTYAALSSSVSASKTINRISPMRQQKNILGIEGALWSENLASYEHLVYMALPKMAGLAEASWSPADNSGQANWKSLSKRLGCGKQGFLHYLYKLYGVHYRGYPNGISLEVPKETCSF